MKKLAKGLKFILIAAFSAFAIYLYILSNPQILSFLPKTKAKINTENISKLRPGMQRKAVIQLMGTPKRIETYFWNGLVIEFLFYATKQPKLFSKLQEKDYTPIAINNQTNTLLSWGWSFYDQVASKKP
ncbi:MAG: DUF3192 domain-containing protein [Candidatus Omnitrophica bacterium]|nr:DUF3192 domain-containing protein [Candidatus Omnitrophota bacterium]